MSQNPSYGVAAATVRSSCRILVLAVPFLGAQATLVAEFAFDSLVWPRYSHGGGSFSSAACGGYAGGIVVTTCVGDFRRV
jgi:hypothetical protein